MKELLTLYAIFARLGAVTFGGGYTMLPLIQRELVEKRGWATNEEVADYYAIGQCTPGIIAVNLSTFIGYKRHGAAGGVAATLGFVTPSVLIILVIASFLQSFAELELVRNAFAGIRVCVTVLIFSAFLKLCKGAVCDRLTAVICAVVFLLACFTGLSPILLVAAAGLCGLLACARGRRGG